MPATTTSTSSSNSSTRNHQALLWTPVESPFGALHIIWQETATGPRVYYVALPAEPWPLRSSSRHYSPPPAPRSHPEIHRIGADLRGYLEGAPVEFTLERMALETCGQFQREVLLAEYGIPRGAVSTYGRIAHAIARPRAARAVGRALAMNPFPIIVPCHRAVQADGRLGGYRGGLSMKRALLRMEGVTVDARDLVLVDHFYY